MTDVDTIKRAIANDGFAIIENIYTTNEIDTILLAITQAGIINPAYGKTPGLFAIRRFLKEVPEAVHAIFTSKLQAVITGLFGEAYFVVKSIYFDKPAETNWFVAWHQDLTISVDKKIEAEGFGPWTVKHNQFGVQPPAGILQDNFTIRIHLDDTDEYNGALKVIPASHLKGIYRHQAEGNDVETVKICRIKRAASC